MSEITIGYIGIVVMVVFMVLGVPIYLSMAMTGFLGILWLIGFDAALGNLASLAYQWGTNWTLITIPLFILMGQFAFHSGISRDLFAMGHKFIGHFPGGLASATVAACTAFGACSASSVANAAAMGVIAIPEMERYKYDKELAAGTVAAGGTIGVMMPPSIGLIVLGIITGQSIGKLFIAGILPALLMMAVFMATITLRVMVNSKLAPSVPAFSWKERALSLQGIWPVVALFLLVIGGIYIGFFTPTEAGAVGCFGSFVFVLFRKQLSLKTLLSSLADTGKISGMIFLLFVGAAIFGNFLALSRLPIELAKWIISLNLPRELTLAFILFIYIPLGCIMELLSGWMVTLPIFFPVVQQLGFDMIWFCILMELIGELGLITPPVGLNVFVIKGVSELPLERIFRGIVPFVIADFIVLLLLYFFPWVSLFLPTMMSA